VGVHGVTGAWGPIATGLFGTVGTQGLVTGSASQFGVQLLAVLAVGLYAIIVTYILVIFLDKTMGLRVSDEEEMQGLDKELHGEVGYNYS